MRTSYLVLTASLLVAASSYVAGHADLQWGDLLTVQHFFGLLGVAGGVVGAFFAKSPMSGEGLLSRATGNGKVKTPSDLGVN